MKKLIKFTLIILVSLNARAETSISYQEIQALSMKVESGDYESFIKTLRLAEENIISAATTEDLMVVAGKFVVIDPEKYLLGIKNWQKNNAIAKRFGCIGIANLGESFVDKFNERAAEIKKRTDLISSVKTRNLSQIKAICLGELNGP